MRGWVLRGCVTYLSYAGWPEIHLSGVCCKRATKGVCHPSHTRRAFCLSKDWLLSALACSAREGGSGGREGGRDRGREGGRERGEGKGEGENVRGRESVV